MIGISDYKKLEERIERAERDRETKGSTVAKSNHISGSSSSLYSQIHPFLAFQHLQRTRHYEY